MSVSPVENLRKLAPVGYVLEGHLLHRSPRDNHSVELFVPHLVEIAVEHHHVFYGSVLRSVALELHKTNLELQGSVREQPHEVGFGRYLQRHQI